MCTRRSTTRMRGPSAASILLYGLSACRGTSTLTSTPSTHLPFRRFLEQKLSIWLEILSVLGITREAVGALKVVAKWLEVRPTLVYCQIAFWRSLISDFSRLIIEFFEITRSSPKIYCSALSLLPKHRSCGNCTDSMPISRYKSFMGH